MTLIAFATSPINRRSALSKSALSKAADASGRGVLIKLVQGAAEATAAPSVRQAEAGNYRKGRISLHGLPIVVETAAGELRRGIGHDGKEWSCKLRHTYGYISRTEGKDGDHVDVIIGPHPESQLVHVVNQMDHRGGFDEHKCVLGCRNEAEAQAVYHDNYEKGWDRCGHIVAMTMPAFKTWLALGKRTRVVPIAKAMAGNPALEAIQKLHGYGQLEMDENPRIDGGHHWVYPDGQMSGDVGDHGSSAVRVYKSLGENHSEVGLKQRLMSEAGVMRVGSGNGISYVQTATRPTSAQQSIIEGVHNYGKELGHTVLLEAIDKKGNNSKLYNAPSQLRNHPWGDTLQKAMSDHWPDTLMSKAIDKKDRATVGMDFDAPEPVKPPAAVKPFVPPAAVKPATAVKPARVATPGKNLLSANIAKAEGSTHKHLIEVMHAFKPDGTLLFGHSNGHESEVEISDEHSKMLDDNPGAVVTHNHPAGHAYPVGHTMHKGHGFSKADLGFAITHKLGEMRAVTPTHIHSIKPGVTPTHPSPWNAGYWHRMNGVYDQHDKAVRNEFGLAVLLGEKTPEDAESQHHEEVMRRTAKHLAMKYTVKEHPYV